LERCSYGYGYCDEDEMKRLYFKLAAGKVLSIILGGLAGAAAGHFYGKRKDMYLSKLINQEIRRVAILIENMAKKIIENAAKNILHRGLKELSMTI